MYVGFGEKVVKSSKKRGKGTREQILKSACEVFAKKGYRDATIADICKNAGANVAAVNYYFGDKETLYAESFRQAFNRSLEIYPPDGGISPDAPAEERLQGRILATMKRFNNLESYKFEIISKELANPTGLLDKTIRASIEPLWRELSRIVRELLGEYVSEEQVALCQMSIIGQCFHLVFRRKHPRLFSANGIQAGQLPAKADIEAVAEHITQFSLGGIGEIRRQIKGGKDKNNPENSALKNKEACESKLLMEKVLR
jgi:AcrR family transcriptional regulator